MKGTRLLGFAVGLMTSQSLAAQEIPPLFIDRGACPFECCRYGPWRATADLLLYETTDTTAAVVARVATGDSVVSEYGEVWSTPTPFVFKAATRGESGREYAAGDTLWVLTYEGEGRFKVRHVDVVGSGEDQRGGGRVVELG